MSGRVTLREALKQARRRQTVKVRVGRGRRELDVSVLTAEEAEILADAAEGLWSVSGENGSVRVTISLSAELLGRVDEHWHRERLRSRSDAFRVLLLEALGGDGR